MKPAEHRNMSSGMFQGLARVGEARRSVTTRAWSSAVRDMLADKDLVKRVHKDWELHLRLILNYQAGEPGYDRVLLKVHHGLIHKAARMVVYAKMSPYDYGDRLQIASLGLLEACGRVDEDRLKHPKGLTTYIWFYVKHRVTRFVYDEGQVVRIPAHWYDKSSPNRIPHRRHAFTFSEMAARRTEEDDQCFEDTLEDDAPLSDDVVEEQTLQEVIMPRLMWYLISQLDARHREVIIDRFAYDQYWRGTVADWREGRQKRGAPASQGPTLTEMGVRMGVSRERVRQLEVTALETMREEAKTLGRGSTFEAWCASVYAGVEAELKRTANLPVSGLTWTLSWYSVRTKVERERAREEFMDANGKKGFVTLGEIPKVVAALGSPELRAELDVANKRVAALTAQVADLEHRLEVNRKQRAQLEEAMNLAARTKAEEGAPTQEEIDALHEELRKARSYGKTYKEKYAASQMHLASANKQLAKLKSSKEEKAPDLAAAARAFQGLVEQGMMTSEEALSKLAGVGAKKGRQS